MVAEFRFTERTLLADIEGKWGAYGAHAEVCRALITEVELLRKRCDRVEEETAEQVAEVERLRSALAVAAGLISTMPQFEVVHPEDVLSMLNGGDATWLTTS